MSRLNETHLAAFNEEISKIASTWYANAGRAVGRFAQRQAHSVTGYMPKGGLEAMRMGSHAMEGASPKALEAARKAEEMGLTSLPGIARAAWKDPAETARRAWGAQVHGTSKLDKALTVGLPAAMLAGDVVSQDDGHKGERMGANIAGTAAGLLTGGMPLAGGMIAGTAASYLGGKAGKGIDKLRGHVQAPPNPEDARGMHVPPEHVMSPSAQNRSEVFG